MRQKPKLHEHKLKRGLKSRDSALSGVNVDPTRRKRPKITYSRLAACRSKFKGHMIQPQKKQRRSPDQTASMAKGMAELHLPFLTSAESCSLSTTEILDKLRWSTPEMPLADDGAWEITIPPSDQENMLRRCTQRNRLDWGVPPKVRPDQAIRKYVQHLYRVGRYGPGLQIPEYWPLFSSVNWDQNHLFPLATDSSESRIRNRKAGSHLYERVQQELGLQQDARIHCHMRSIQQPRVRMQWQLMQSMRPSWFKWRHQTEASKLCSSRRNAAHLDYNQNSLNSDIWPQTAMAAFLRPLRSQTDEYSPAVVFLSETRTASETGRLIMDVVATDAFPSQSRESLSWPPLLSQGMQTPIIDYTCRARHVSFGEYQRFQPLLFAAQRESRNPRQAFKQLAMALQPMMTLFILYHLDTRSHPEEPMPYWMVLFGAVYHEGGLVVQAYHPSFSPPISPLGESDCNWGWGANSLETCYEHYLDYAMTSEPWHRGPALEILRNIQCHCNVVLEHLQHWDGYDRACQRISLSSA